MQLKDLKYLITTDSGCDLTSDKIEELKVIPYFMKYIDKDDTFIDTMRDCDTIKFYESMKKGKLYTTTSINIQEGYTFFKELYLKYNLPIIHISLSSSISSTYNNMVLASKLVKEEYTNASIHVIDSAGASLVYGMQVIESSKLRSEGKAIEEVIDYLEKSKHSINTYYTTSNLTTLQKGGRVTKIESIFGQILSIRPILKLNYDGKLLICSKGHGKNNTYRKIVEYIKNTVIDPKNNTLYISHANNIEEAKALCEIICKEIPFKNTEYYMIGSIIGSHTGPGLIAYFYHGIERTN